MTDYSTVSQMADRIMVAIIGCGEIAYRSAQAIRKSEMCLLESVCDIDADRAAVLGHTQKVRWYASVDRFLETSQAQVVYIATPHYAHFEVSALMLRAGRHVLVEKPLCLLLSQIDELSSIACERKLKLACALETPVNPTFLMARDLIAEGAIGDIRQILITYLKDKSTSYWDEGWTRLYKSDWRKKAKTAGGGVLLMNGIHLIDAMLFVTMLPVVSVFGRCVTSLSEGVEVEDTVSCVFNLGNGAIGTLVASGCAIGSNSETYHRLRIIGTKGQIVLCPGLELYQHGNSQADVSDWQHYPIPSSDIRASMFDHFATSILQPSQVSSPLGTGRQALQMILSIYQSSQTNKLTFL